MYLKLIGNPTELANALKSSTDSTLRNNIPLASLSKLNISLDSLPPNALPPSAVICFKINKI